MRHQKGLPDGVRQPVHVPHNVVVLGDGHGDTSDVNLLKAVLSQQGRGDVTGDGNHGDGVHVGSGDSRYQVGGSGAAGGHHHANLAGRAAVAVGSVGGSLLVGGEDVADSILVLVQLVVDIQDGTAGVAEDHVHTLLHQAFYDDSRTSVFHCSIAPWSAEDTSLA